MAVKFKIERYDPQIDAVSKMREYSLEVPESSTLLDCLNLIKWTIDGKLTFRMSCRSAICGSCAMRVNGHAMLACKTQAADVIIGNEVTIQPLGNFKIIKDLVVDLESFWESLERVDPWLKADESVTHEKERYQSAHDFKLIDDASTCILCASCYSDCNVLEVDERFLGPASLAKAQRFVYDSRDIETDSRLEMLSETNGMWDCTHCAECSTRCPTDAKPLSRITELKVAAMKEGYHNNNGARHVLAFRESVGGAFTPITGGGMINENYIPVRSVGFFNISGLLEILPVGLRMFMRGKQPPMLPHTIKKMKEVRNIFKRFKEYLR